MTGDQRSNSLVRFAPLRDEVFEGAAGGGDFGGEALVVGLGGESFPKRQQDEACEELMTSISSVE
jgi:hypothetical protein